MADAYSPDDLHHGYNALGHRGRGYTELTILHPAFRRDDHEWNRAHQSWPLTRYVTSVAGVEGFVREYAGERLVCYGINPRPAILTNPDGRLRSARDQDIAICQNLVLDVDLHGMITTARLEDLKGFLARADEYFTSLGLQRPLRALTGRGAHLLFGFPPTSTQAYPDVRERLRSFRDAYHHAMRSDLARLEARIDHTQDLRRVVRCYGTSKPDVGYVSRFFGRARVEDAGLRDYLLRLPTRAVAATPAACPPLSITSELPGWFVDLLDHDERLQKLWRGEGKPTGLDQSSTGYDYSIARYLIRHGCTQPDELGTIIALRPDGSVRRHQKGREYVRRTVQNALSHTMVREELAPADGWEDGA